MNLCYGCDSLYEYAPSGLRRRVSKKLARFGEQLHNRMKRARATRADCPAALGWRILEV